MAEACPDGRIRKGCPTTSINVVVRLHASSKHMTGVPPDVFVGLCAIYPDVELADSAQGTSALGTAGTESHLLGQLEHDIDATAFAHLAEYVMLHAGVVAAGDACILIPAASGAGKSTLVAALSLSGFQYLSDEFAVLCPATLRAHAYAKSICLKAGGWRIIQEEFGVTTVPVEVQRSDGQVVRFLAAPHPFSSQQGAAVRAVLIPNRQPHGPAELVPIPAADALGVLMHQSLNLPWHGASGLDALARVVESAACYQLTYAHLHDAVAVVNTLIDDDKWVDTR